MPIYLHQGCLVLKQLTMRPKLPITLVVPNKDPFIQRRRYLIKTAKLSGASVTAFASGI
jgi:hypothetical protein